MARNILILLILSIFLSACGTHELHKARRKIDQRYEVYSQQAGTLYRYPPTEKSYEAKAPSLPAGMTMSYSPLTGETTLVPLHDGRSMPAKQREQSKERVASYSPLTGETLWVAD